MNEADLDLERVGLQVGKLVDVGEGQVDFNLPPVCGVRGLLDDKLNSPGVRVDALSLKTWG